MPFRAPEAHRVRKNKLATTAEAGNNGLFALMGNEILYDDKDKPVKSPVVFVCIASDQQMWQHVSIAVQRPGRPRYPTFDEIKAIRKLFWPGDGDSVFTWWPSDKYREDGAPIVELWAKPGFAFPVPPSDMMDLNKKSLIEKITF